MTFQPVKHARAESETLKILNELVDVVNDLAIQVESGKKYSAGSAEEEINKRVAESKEE